MSIQLSVAVVAGRAAEPPLLSLTLTSSGDGH
jgi:hypothetical protein